MSSPAVVRVALCLVLASCALAAHGQDRPTMARLAGLLNDSEKTGAAELLRRALADADPRVRGAAARVANVLDVRELQEVVRQASDAETDPAARREQIRAMAALAGLPVPWPPDSPMGPRPRARTLSDLPAGFAKGVFESAGCKMPPEQQLGMARVTYDSLRRPATIETVKMSFARSCRDAAMALLRAGLAPDALTVDPREVHTVYIVLGPDQEARLDELAPPGETAVRSIPERTTFKKPEFPRGKHGVGARMVMQFLPDSRGVPGNIEVIESAGEEFDWEGVLSLSQWRYQPAAASIPLMAVIDWQKN